MDIAKSSKRTVIGVQIGEALLLVVAAVLIAVLMVIVIGNRHRIAVLEQQNAAQNQAIATEQHRILQALCDDQYTIGTLPVDQSTTRPIVGIVEAHRKAFVVLGCPGRLGPPPRSLLIMGSRLGVPVRY